MQSSYQRVQHIRGLVCPVDADIQRQAVYGLNDQGVSAADEERPGITFLKSLCVPVTEGVEVVGAGGRDLRKRNRELRPAEAPGDAETLVIDAYLGYATRH